MIKYYKSKVTGNLYEFNKYTNHGYGGTKLDYIDLPKDEYPYTIIELIDERNKKKES